MRPLAAFSLLLAMPQGTRAGESPPPEPAPPPVRHGYEVVHRYPHDRAAFTQGLVYHAGHLLESTGLEGRSTLRKVDPVSGRVLQLLTLPPDIFAEGLARHGNNLYQLTWLHRRGFIWHADTLEPIGRFAYTGEGWGLASDGVHLIRTDGTSHIVFHDPHDFRELRTITAHVEGRPLKHLNELEWIDGRIYANVWQTDYIAIIHPDTGAVTGLADLSGLLPRAERAPDTDVLNGIAHDPGGDRLFVTGKHWPFLYEIRLVPRPAPDRDRAGPARDDRTPR